MPRAHHLVSSRRRYGRLTAARRQERGICREIHEKETVMLQRLHVCAPEAGGIYSSAAASFAHVSCCPHLALPLRAAPTSTSGSCARPIAVVPGEDATTPPPGIFPIFLLGNGVGQSLSHGRPFHNRLEFRLSSPVILSGDDVCLPPHSCQPCSCAPHKIQLPNGTCEGLVIPPPVASHPHLRQHSWQGGITRPSHVPFQNHNF